MEAMAGDTTTEIALQCMDVERISTAAIQVILAGAEASRRAARRLTLENGEPVVRPAFGLLGLEADFQTLSAP